MGLDHSGSQRFINFIYCDECNCIEPLGTGSNKTDTEYM